MAVLSSAVPVTTTATRLDTVDDSGDHLVGESFVFFNNAAATIIYIGGSGVTTATGTPVAAQTWSPGMDLQTGDAVYGIVTSGTAEARVLETGI